MAYSWWVNAIGAVTAKYEDLDHCVSCLGYPSSCLRSADSSPCRESFQHSPLHNMAAAAAAATTATSNSPSNSSSLEPLNVGHGHFFTKKTFHKPSYCHHCTDMLWGIIRQGFVCEGSYTPQKRDGGTHIFDAPYTVL